MASYWTDRPTLVTGATGLLGSWLVKRLVAEGAQVVCLMRDWVPASELVRSGALQQVSVVRGDVADQALLERALGEYEVHTVFHLAAQTIVGIANRNAAATFATNVGGTWALMEACRRSPTVESVVVASSDKAYGAAEVLPYDEDTPLRGTHPYDASKACADLVAHSYARTFAVPAAITRCGNFYGGGDLNFNRLVPGTIRSVLRGQRPVIRSDGTYVRDYFYVEEGVGAYMLLAQRVAEDSALVGQAFNFSDGTPLSVTDLVGRILAMMQSPLVPEVQNQASHEITAQYLSSQKARTLLGWAPSLSLDEGLARTIAWYREFLQP